MINRWRIVLAPVSDDPLWSAPRVFRPEDFGPGPHYQRSLPGSPVMAAVLRSMAEEPDQAFRVAVVADVAASGDRTGDPRYGALQWSVIAWSPLLDSLISLPSEGRCPDGMVWCPSERLWVRPGDIPDLCAVRPRDDLAGDIPFNDRTGSLAGVPLVWMPPSVPRWPSSRSRP